MATQSDTAREQLRAENRVRLVQSREEGTAARELPAGVYGFTGSPGLAAPLFATRRYRNFEIHHLHDGEIAIVGFVAPRDVSRLAHARAPVELTIYPDAEGEASEILAIHYSQIAQHRQYSIRNAVGLSLSVQPVSVQPPPMPSPSGSGPHVAP